MPRQVVPLPRLAGEQQDLTLFALGQQDIQRGAEPSVIEGYQRVVQNQRDVLLLRQHHAADSKAYRQI